MIYDPAVQGLLLKAKDFTLKAKDLTFKAKDSKFVLEDTSRPRTKAKDNNTACDSKGCGFCTPGRTQVVRTHEPLSPSSVIWYRSRGGNALRLGR